MRKILYGMFLCAMILAGCQGAAKKTDTPAATAHIVPPAYPAPGKASLANPTQANPAYPGPQAVKPTAPGAISSYPGPGSSAGATPVANPYAPVAGDESKERGTVTVDIKNSGVITVESSPVQVSLKLQVTLPNTCYRLRVNPAQPDAQKNIQVEVYSILESGEICTQVTTPMTAEIRLESYPAGHYTVYINGELLGAFDS